MLQREWCTRHASDVTKNGQEPNVGRVEQRLWASRITFVGRYTSGDAWVWVAFAPVWRLVVAFVIGKRTQQSADLLLDRGLHVTAAPIPFFTSDQ
jgi:hypothetical protein